jgi:hypothetical protein
LNCDWISVCEKYFGFLSAFLFNKPLLVVDVSVTAEDENNDTVKVCIVLPGLTKKFGSKSKAKNGTVEVDFGTRYHLIDAFLILGTEQYVSTSCGFLIQ